MPPRTPAKWVFGSRDSQLEARFAKELDLSPLVASALVGLGISDLDEASRFLHPDLGNLHDPRLLPDFQPAIELLLQARDAGDLIFLHGDYDVDGVTSTALFHRFLTKIGCKVYPHVPHRTKEGYGIHADMVDEAVRMGAKLLLTCDCGASAFDQIAAARESGMKVVVTDHHHVGDEMPNAHAFVNPHRPDSKYPFAHLCGAGVVFKLCQGMTKEVGMPVDKYQRAFLDLATLGTIADMMPLLDENRIIVHHGLPLLSKTKKHGLTALFEAASLTQKAISGLDTYNVGFGIAPRLNAAGRIDDSSKSLRLLLADSSEEAIPIAVELEELNRRRKEQQEAMVQEALQMVSDTGQLDAPIIVLRADDWHPGIVGIVAGRIKDHFHRPVFVLSLDEDGETYKGSGRSIDGFHLAEIIKANPDLVSGGGHAKAAGMSVEKGRFDEMVVRFKDYAATALSPDDLVPTIHVSGELSMSEIDSTLLDQLKSLEPFGEGNRAPVFCIRGAELHSIRPTKNPDHPFPSFVQDGGNPVRFKAFGFGSRLSEVTIGSKMDLLVELGFDEWMGSKSIGVSLKDFAVLDD